MGLLLIDCCMYISLAMFSGLVSILIFLSMMHSSGGTSWFLKTFLFFFGFFSYSCLYFDLVFLIQSWVYFVVILRACMFAALASSAKVLIHSCWFCF